MLRPLILSAAFAPSLLFSQTIVSVQSGFWSDPATWSCSCVPEAGTSVVVMHGVGVEGSFVFDQEQVQITAGGTVYSLGADVTISTLTFINEGVLNLSGEVLVTGLLNSAGYTEVNGDLVNEGTIMIDVMTRLWVIGDFTNYFILGGEGVLCVSDSTINHQDIIGSVDVCDYSPTGTTPPILDVNTGTVGPDVQFCSLFGFCLEGGGVVDAGSFESTAIQPNPAQGIAIISNLPSRSTVQLFDATGAMVLAYAPSGIRLAVDLKDLQPGLYLVRLSSKDGMRTLPLIVE